VGGGSAKKQKAAHENTTPPTPTTLNTHANQQTTQTNKRKHTWAVEHLARRPVVGIAGEVVVHHRHDARRAQAAGAQHVVGVQHVRLVPVVAPAVGAGDEQRPVPAHVVVVAVGKVLGAERGVGGSVGGVGARRRWCWQLLLLEARGARNG
jgi:hypothetical protein